MKTAKAKIAHRLIFSIAVTLTGVTAQAGLYEHIDDHSHDIEREAERANAIVKYNFRHAPPSIVQYLREGLYGIAKSAHELHELTKCSGNVLAIDAVASQLDVQFHEVEEGVLVLQELATGSNCSVRRFSSSFAPCKPRTIDRANLTSLNRRIRDIDEELHDMRKDLQKVLAAHHRCRHSSHGHIWAFGRALAPVSNSQFQSSRQTFPTRTYERPEHDFSRNRKSSLSFSSSFGRSSRDSRCSSRSCDDDNSGGHSRHSDSSYIHTRIGGFGLSFRLR